MPPLVLHIVRKDGYAYTQEFEDGPWAFDAARRRLNQLCLEEKWIIEAATIRPLVLSKTEERRRSRSDDEPAA